MTPEQLAELQSAWPGSWVSEAYAPEKRWMRFRGDVFVACAHGDFRSLGSNYNWHATGVTFAECLKKLKRLMRDDAIKQRRRAEDIERTVEDMP